MILKGILDGISDGIKSVLCFTDRAYIKINGKPVFCIYNDCKFRGSWYTLVTAKGENTKYKTPQGVKKTKRRTVEILTAEH